MKLLDSLARELARDLGNNVKSNNAENEDERKHENNDGVDLQTGRLVGVEPQHRAAATTGAGGAGAAWPSIGDLLLLVGGRPAADGSAGTTGGRRRRGTVDAGTCRGGRGVGRRGGSGRRHADLMCGRRY